METTLHLCLSLMSKTCLPILLLCLTLCSCEQPLVSGGAHTGSNTVNSKAPDSEEPFIVDTSKIAILPVDTANYWLFKDAVPFSITNGDLQEVDKLLQACIDSFNSTQDTTKRFSEYIGLANYKRQYVPFVNSKGEKKVYVNCFCTPHPFDYWKKSLVEVMDGGNCFFQLTLNLSLKQCEELQINGYAFVHYPSSFWCRS